MFHVSPVSDLPLPLRRLQLAHNVTMSVAQAIVNVQITGRRIVIAATIAIMMETVAMREW